MPHTIIRDGPAGTGMLQLWIEQPDDANEDQPSVPDLVDLCPVDAVPAGYLSAVRAYDYTGEEVRLVHADNPRLRQMAVFDVIVNNADRKGGHILNGLDGQVYGVDHGLALHVQDKLRTVLWGWAGKPIDDQTLSDLADLEKILGASLGSEMCIRDSLAGPRWRHQVAQSRAEACRCRPGHPE